MVSAVTDGIRVSVETFYLPEQSQPDQSHWAFAYRVTIRNESARAVQLLRRHWIICDANEQVTEVLGDGVVGEQPVLSPGAEHTYTSGTHLETSTGTMHGSYELQDEDGKLFRVAIPLFNLGRAETLH
jgi:ApaG protein